MKFETYFVLASIET